MSNKFAPLSAFILLLGASLPGLPSPLGATGLEVTRSPNQAVLLDGPSATARHCWARYATHGAEPVNGLIEEKAFRVPCPELMTQDFLATLQRALAARGFYDGPITGRVDQSTRSAVQAFQRSTGFNSPILTLETAQRLGLVPADLAGR
jgi:hypothetical protein